MLQSFLRYVPGPLAAAVWTGSAGAFPAQAGRSAPLYNF